MRICNLYLILTCLLLPLKVSFADELIVNGTFDSGLSSWSLLSISGPGSISTSTGPACAPSQAGNPCAALDAYSNGIRAIEQSVTIPASISSATLSFLEFGQLDPTTVSVIIIDENSASHQLDSFVAVPMISSYTLPGPVFICTGNSPATKNYDLSSYAGQTIKVRLQATSPGGDGTFALFDDVSVTTSVNASPTPTPPAGSGKRNTAIQIFCNRTGVNLGTAKCSVTVADKGVAPNIVPTGTVDFVASKGFFPGAASCLLQQTQFSPGIGSCDVEFAVPDGFGIGIAFPIDAVYQGNSKFNSSATSHELINASCVGDATNPCSGAVSLGFADVPEILKNVIELVVGCGGSIPSSSAVTVTNRILASPAKKGKKPQTCNINVASSTNIVKTLAQLDAKAMTDLSVILGPPDPNASPEVLAVHEIAQRVHDHKKVGGLPWNEVRAEETKLEEAYYEMILKQPKPAVLSSNLEIAGARKPALINLGVRKGKVKLNRQKSLSIRVPRDAFKLLKALKAVGVNELNTTISLKGKRKGQVPAGTVRKFALTQVVTAGINN